MNEYDLAVDLYRRMRRGTAERRGPNDAGSGGQDTTARRGESTELTTAGTQHKVFALAGHPLDRLQVLALHPLHDRIVVVAQCGGRTVRETTIEIVVVIRTRTNEHVGGRARTTIPQAPVVEENRTRAVRVGEQPHRPVFRSPRPCRVNKRAQFRTDRYRGRRNRCNFIHGVVETDAATNIVRGN